MKEVIDYIKATTSYSNEEATDFIIDDNRTAFENWLLQQPKANDVTLYRGYTFDSRYWEDCSIEEGSIIAVDQLTQSIELPAFTSDILRAVKYMNDFGEVGITDNVKVLFEIETHGKYMVDISQYSKYPEEREYRCIRGISLLINNIYYKGGFIKVKCKEV